MVIRTVDSMQAIIHDVAEKHTPEEGLALDAVRVRVELDHLKHLS